MRPLKLTISAIGPYAGVEIIDFTMLKGKNIFLITGPTGAGKTTIFDAISYALFGEASGSSRDKDCLRSDFASLEISTYVELEFELRGKKYYIRRFPQQQKKKTRGEGLVLKNAEAELILPSGDVITKVNTVDEKISSILGINKNQFRQIVMLPQGEFKKLLESDSSEREVIFRKIFGTEAFEVIQRKLDDQKKAIYRKISDTKTQRDTHVKHIEAGEDELLVNLTNAADLNIIEIVNRTKELVKKDGEESGKLKKEIKKLKLDQEKLQKSIAEGEETNKKLKEKEEIYHQYQEYLLKEKEYEEKQIHLNKARKALEVKLVEDSFIDKQNNLKLKDSDYHEAKQKLKKAEESLALCKVQLETEEAKENERKKLSDSIATLKSQEEKVKNYEEKMLKRIELRDKVNIKEKAINDIKLSINDEKLKQEKANKALIEAQKAEIQKEKLDKAIYEKDLVIKDMRSLYNAAKEYINKVNKHHKDSERFEEFDKKYNSFKSKYEDMEDSFRKGQAGLLAKELKEGDICPVCGSTHHPKLAQLVDGVPTEEKLNEAKADYNKLKDHRDTMLQELSHLNGTIKNSKETLLDEKDKLKLVLGEDLSKIKEKEMINYLTAKGKEIANELAQLKEEQAELEKFIKQKQVLEDSIKKISEYINNKEVLTENLVKEYRDLYAKVISEEELLISIEKEIPQEIRSFAKLSSKVKEFENNLYILEEAYKGAQQKYNRSNIDYVSSKKDIESKANNLEEAVKEVERLQEQLNNRIKAADFEDYKQYILLRLSEEGIDILEKDILEYKENLKSLKDRLERYIKETEGLNEVSIQQLNDDLGELKSQEEKLESIEKNIFSRINNNKKALKEIEQINESIREDEEKYKVIGDLAKTANGENSERITFERYVLAAYFDEIINAANVRLNKMAGGRFILRRKEEKGKGRKQEGLELEVFDNYTGKARHVKTLSGGESFKASLALALGLADVVQSYVGGISLDTMFVDEGFGTLDPESLDNSIQCLIDLQKGGRLVGIISHVPDLKERIDVRLEITQTKEGSKAKFVV